MVFAKNGGTAITYSDGALGIGAREHDRALRPLPSLIQPTYGTVTLTVAGETEPAVPV